MENLRSHLAMTYLYALLAFLAAWNLAPLVMLSFLPVPSDVKRKAALSLLVASWRGLRVIIPALIAPLVVPLALVTMDRADNRLPRWARWWDNDVSVNGDRPEYWDEDYTGTTYYANAHPRSFWARYVWLGWRNRASALSLSLGHRYTPGEYEDAQDWGDPKTGRDHAGWALNRRGPAWQLYVIKRLGRLCFRLNYGFKVWSAEGDHRPVAMVVNISASVLRWTGPA
jgi:hypothetical protein